MILQALADYYDRKAAGEDQALAPFGFEHREVPFVIVLDPAGRFVDLEDTRSLEGKRKVGRIFLVPQAIKRSSGIAANLLWDGVDYVLGEVPASKAAKLAPAALQRERERCADKQAAFVAAVREVFPGPKPDEGVAAVMAFLERADFDAVRAHALWPEAVEGPGSFSFRLEGESRLVCQRPAVREAVAQSAAAGDGPEGRCLVSGGVQPLARLHPTIKGVRGGQPTGGNIVSFNLPAFSSFGKDQGLNAPVGERAAFAYTTALNHLLRRGSRQRMQVADATTVFWTEHAHPVEEWFRDWFDTDRDDPDRNAEAVRALYAAPQSGRPPLDEDGTRIYVLGLAPNAARIAVRLWQTGTVGSMARNVRQHFEDIRLVHGPREPDFPTLFRLLVSTAVRGEAEGIAPNVAGETMRAILAGTPYPRELLAAAVRRARAEQGVTHPRGALIKACLNRQERLYPTGKKEVTVSLDESNTNVGYRLGRLFAVLEKAQEEANPGINATIRDRYYGAAAGTPGTVLPILLKLKNHHVAKLENRGRAHNLEKLIGRIVDGIGGADGFPTHLSLADQGRFAIGYYHQREAFYHRTATEAPAA